MSIENKLSDLKKEKMKLGGYIIYFGGMGVILLALVIGLYIASLCFYPWELVKFYDLSVQEQVVTPGQYFHYTIRIDKNTPVLPEVKYHLVDSVIYNINYEPNYVSEGKNRTVTFALLMPKNIPRGEYILEIVATYTPNIFRKETYQWRSNKFKVTEEFKSDQPIIDKKGR